jgi:hypothetical protein
MWTHSLPHLLGNFLSAIFAIAAIIDMAGFLRIREWLRQSWHPRQSFRVMGVLELITSIFLAIAQLRIWGIPLAGLITFFWVVTFLNHRQWSRAAAGMLLMMTLVPASLAIY